MAAQRDQLKPLLAQSLERRIVDVLFNLDGHKLKDSNATGALRGMCAPKNPRYFPAAMLYLVDLGWVTRTSGNKRRFCEIALTPGAIAFLKAEESDAV